MNITREDFCNRLNYIVYKAIEFDLICSHIDESQDLPEGLDVGEISFLRDDCLSAMCDYLVEVAVTKPHNCYVDFVSSCLTFYIWAINENEFDYDYYFDLISNDLHDNGDLPENFSKTMLCAAAQSACRVNDFYDLLSMAESYVEE